MTPSNLKYLYEINNPDGHFFDRQTMKFFGDTMANFGCRRTTIALELWAGGAQDVSCWELYRKRPVKHGLQSSHYFDDNGNEIMGVIK